MLHDDLLESIGLRQLLPSSLASWQPLLAEGMVFFLEHLPAPRQEAILAHQLALPASADAARRLATLLVQCPTLHKLGQVLARNRQLPEEIRLQLQKLESMPPTTPMEPVLARLHDELPDDPSLVVAREALAEGSVAVIVPFTYKDDGQVRDGVFKVLKPGIEEKFDEEIGVWGALGSFLEERGRRLGLPVLDYRRTLDSVRELLTNEIHLRVEQHNMRAAHAFYAHEPRILVPRLLPWCTPRVTAMERVFGMKVTDARLSRQRREDLASTLVSSLVGQPFWSIDQSAMFHADLHAGNLFATDDGRLAVLDWSLTLRLSKADRGLLVSIILGGLMLDGDRIRKAVAALGTIAAHDPILEKAVERALDRVAFQGRVPGFDWVLDFLDGLALETATGFREDFVLFRKTWFSLSDVIGDMVGAHSADAELLKLGLTRFWTELPARWFALSGSADLSTHVSNAGILQACASACFVPMRYWARFWKWRGLPVSADGASQTAA